MKSSLDNQNPKAQNPRANAGQEDSRTVSEVGEFELIDRLVAALGEMPLVTGLGSSLVLGAGDDCAAAARPGPGALTLFTTDTMVSGIHFLPEFPPEDLGWKSLATNISDIASMGGLPTMALVTLAIPACLNLEWLLGWYRGMGECARTYNVNVCGGDIVRTLQDVAITVSLSGEVEAERMVTRSGVCVGDRLIVTGCLGDSAGGLALHQAGVPGFASLLKTHLQPQPRVTEARLASCSCQVHGMLDLSDGLGGDLRHLCEASGVGARVDSASIPISAELRRAAIHLKQSALQFAIRGGEDYELLLAVSPASVQPTLDAIASAGRISGTVIGTILPASAGVLLITEDGAEWELDRSFTHF